MKRPRSPSKLPRLVTSCFRRFTRSMRQKQLTELSDFRGRIAAVEILKSTPRTREYIENGETEGKSLLDAMRDGKLDGMQDFDTVIRDLIERNIVTVEDGLGFATNQNNLLLSLKGLTSGEDYVRAQTENLIANNQRAHYPAAFTLTD